MPSRYAGFPELTELECAIGRRVRAARKHVRLSQSKLAPVIGLTRDQLSNIEIGRVGLRFGAGWRLCAELDINPLWLALGPQEATEKHGFARLPGIDDAANDDRLFSIVIDIWRRPDGPWCGWRGYAVYRAQILKRRDRQRKDWEALKHRELVKWFAEIPFDDHQVFWSTVRRYAAIYARSLAATPTPEATINVALRASSPNLLTMPGTKIGSWKELRNQLKQKTASRGAKAYFARRFGVSVQVLSQWLSGASAPKADTALRLREAVLQEQKKRPGRAETLPGLKTQKSKSVTYEKAKSDRKRQ